uniref:Uncharacterized protein n=1 Tax=Arundo donax TaxID=35708 RepID=A0A0A9G2I1_ARUDO
MIIGEDCILATVLLIFSSNISNMGV